MNTHTIEQPPTYIPPPQIHTYGRPLHDSLAQSANADKHVGMKFRTAFLATVAFVLLSNMVAYRLVNQLFWAFTGKTNEVLSDMGVPTAKGMFLHGCIFFVTMVLVIRNL